MTIKELKAMIEYLGHEFKIRHLGKPRRKRPDTLPLPEQKRG